MKIAWPESISISYDSGNEVLKPPHALKVLKQELCRGGVDDAT